MIKKIIPSLLLSACSLPLLAATPDYGAGSTLNLTSISKLTPKMNSARAADGRGTPVASRTNFNTQGFLSNGTDTLDTYRTQHIFANYTSDIRLMWWNGYLNTSNAEVVGPNSVTLTQGFEYNGTTYQCTWNGATSIVVAPGQRVYTDCIPIDIPAGGTAYDRTAFSVSSGQKWPMGLTGVTNATVDSYSNDGVDRTTSTGALANSSLNKAQGAPTAIFGSPYVAATGLSQPGVIIVGDSISYGTGDTPDQSYIVRYLNAQGYGFIQEARVGSQASQWAVTNNIPARLATLSTGDAIWIALGANDCSNHRTLAQLKADVATILLTAKARGLMTFVMTIPPHSTSTDNWTTVANQTKFLSGADETTRTGYNQYARNPANWTNFNGVSGANIDYVFDVCQTVESSQDSGLWIAPTVQSFTNSGGTVTFTSSQMKDTANNFAGMVGKRLCVTTGGGAGKNYIITGVSTGTNPNDTLTISGSFSPSPANGDTYIVDNGYTLDGLHPAQPGHIAIQNAIAAVSTALFAWR